MHKIILKIFAKSRSLIHFFKIVTVFIIMMLNLYWAQNLIGADWNWLHFIKPLLDTLISIGESFSDKSIKLFAAVFEFKYFIAILLLLGIYVILDWCIKSSDKLQDIYEGWHELFRQAQEKALNKTLINTQIKKQQQLQKFSIYISARQKNDRVSKLININIEEQQKAMNKFLTEQTGITPKRYSDGFLYEFRGFDDIDQVLTAFFKILNSGSPMDYKICVVLSETESALQKLDKLISLENINKITMFSDVAYRYSFIDSQKYETFIIGDFQNENENFEIHEFKNNLF